MNAPLKEHSPEGTAQTLISSEKLDFIYIFTLYANHHIHALKNLLDTPRPTPKNSVDKH